MANLIVYTMKLIDQITPSLKSINRAIGETAVQKRRLGKELESVGKGITGVGKSLLPMSAAIVGAGVMAGKAFMDFDSTITMAGLKAGATASEVESLRETAKKLGADFPISASTAAKAMENLAASGYNANEIIGAMPAIVTSSVASAEDLSEVSATITNAMNIWNLKQGDVAKNASHVGDVIAMAANKSKLALGDFSIAMQYAGAPAASLGVGLEELATAMAVMRDGGIEASAVGTSLRGTLSRLAAPTKDVQTALDALGVKTTDANGKFVGLTSVLEQMRKGMAGMSETQRVALAQTIAGTNGYSGLLMLLNKNTDAYKDLQTAITNSDGAAKKAADTMNQTFSGSIANLQSKIESFAIGMFKQIEPSVSKFINSIASVFEWLDKLSPTMKNIMIDVGAFIVGFTGAALVVGKLVTVGGSLMITISNVQKVIEGGTIANKGLQYSVMGLTKAYGFLQIGATKAMATIQAQGAIGAARTAFMSLSTGIWSAVRASVAFAMTPIGLAIMAIAAAVYLLYSNWDKIAPILIGMWNKLKEVFANAMKSFKPHIDKVVKALQPLFDAFKTVCSWITSVGTPIFELLSNVVGFMVVNAFNVLSTYITSVFSVIFGVITSYIGMVMDVFAGLITFLTGVFTGNWEQAWQGIVQIFDGVFGGIKGICEAVMGGIKDTINSVIKSINAIDFKVPEWVPGIGGKHFESLNIPMLYTGTENWSGGTAMIHDKGAEIVDLPSGSRVIPHDKSLQQAYSDGRKEGGLGNITVNLNNVSVNNVSDIKKLAERVASEIYYEVKKHSVNMAEGAV